MDQEKNEISQHEVQVFLCVKKAQRWLSNKEIARETGMSERTVRHHTLKLVKLGIFDVAEIFPAHRFRLSEKAERRNASYAQRLKFVCEVLGLS